MKKEKNTHTRLTFNSRLNADTPMFIIQALKYMNGDIKEEPEGFPFPGDMSLFFRHWISEFGVVSPVNKIEKDTSSGEWIVFLDSSYMCDEKRIDKFINWIKPYMLDSIENYTRVEKHISIVEHIPENTTIKVSRLS